jgi:hypothetical protein
MKLLVTVVLSMSMLTACARPQATWSMVGGSEIIENEGIEIEWPQDWMKLTPAESNEYAKKEGWILTVTRDGMDLQSIILKKRPMDQGFTNTQKKAVPGMLPQELAELVLDDMRANPNVLDLQLVETSPSAFDGIPGYKIVVRYRNKAGLPRQAVQYGCIEKGLLYTLIYDAPQRHYYALDLPTFEAVKSSFKWKAQSKPS